MQKAETQGYNIEFVWPDDISSNPALACSFFGSAKAGRITMWVSGHCEIEVLSASDSSEILRQSHVLEHENKVSEALSRFDTVVFG